MEKATENLYISKETFREILSSYRNIVLDSSDLEDVFNLVYDLLKAEEEALRAAEPCAFRTIRELGEAATCITSNNYYFCDAYEEVFCDE